MGCPRKEERSTADSLPWSRSCRDRKKGSRKKSRKSKKEKKGKKEKDKKKKSHKEKKRH